MDTIDVHQVEQMDANKLAQLDYELRMDLASNRDTPPRILVMLAKDKDAHIRGFVASNRSTPVEVLYELAHDKKRYPVVTNLACNSSAPAELLKLILEIPDETLELLVAGNLNISEEIALKLVKSSRCVRLNLAFNPNVTKKVIAILLKDEDYTVKAVAAEWVLNSLLASEDETIRACAEFYLSKKQ